MNDNEFVNAGRLIARHVDPVIRAKFDIHEAISGDDLVALLASDEPGEGIFLDLRDRAEVGIAGGTASRAAGIPDSLSDADRFAFVDAIRRWETLLCQPVSSRSLVLGMEAPATVAVSA